MPLAVIHSANALAVNCEPFSETNFLGMPLYPVNKAHSATKVVSVVVLLTGKTSNHSEYGACKGPTTVYVYLLSWFGRPLPGM